MTFLSIKGLALGTALLASTATAQEFSAPPADPTQSSPFAFAESHKKAERTQEMTKDGSGSRVIGGELAAPGAWPWQVGLMIAGQPVTPDAHFCGGSLILDTWVLTAAHCVHMQDKDGSYFDLDPRQLTVLVGTNTIAPGKGDNIPVAGVFRNPGYNPQGWDGDVALLKLARRPNVPVRPIKVPDADFGNVLDQAGVPTVVTGWGLVNGGEHPSDMYQAEIQMMSREMCNGAIMEARAKSAAQSFGAAASTFGLSRQDAQDAWVELVKRAPLPLTENMLCSGSFEGGKTSCQGDSGGPLVVPLDDGSYVQAGVVSWGLSAGPNKTCAENAIFSAYTKVSNFLPWLNQTISAN
ncbi:serine protease [Thalassovita taeanensis]|uniref:Trypsin n=1 Tax=Thalassovita taeanensis TaxID=657014 RepID=A0A1H9AFX9_9RHOB|nr:serine protease [Thalassovita taeanensis]SEP75692.1 Trypsin [Thalassovita taeanensis]